MKLGSILRPFGDLWSLCRWWGSELRWVLAWDYPSGLWVHNPTATLWEIRKSTEIGNEINKMIKCYTRRQYDIINKLRPVCSVNTFIETLIGIAIRICIMCFHYSQRQIIFDQCCIISSHVISWLAFCHDLEVWIVSHSPACTLDWVNEI